MFLMLAHRPQAADHYHHESPEQRMDQRRLWIAAAKKKQKTMSGHIA
jgi:hypothetical protein